MGLADTRDPNSLSTKLRRRRDIQLRSLISSIAETRGGITILDLGGTLEYWQRVGFDFLREQGARITLLNRQSSELSDVTAYSDVFEVAVGDACDLSQYADRVFDLVHSNSVIEHVETWANMKAFAAETRRVGGSYYVQTPYFWFPIDPHFYKVPFFHWLPRPTRASILNRFSIAYSGRIDDIGMAYEIVDRARLLDGRQFRYLFPDAAISFERFSGLPKSLLAVKDVSRSNA